MTAAPSFDRALLTKREAAEYLRVSVTFFLDHVRPYVPMVDLRRPLSKKPVPRWTRADLDSYIAAHRIERR